MNTDSNAPLVVVTYNIRLGIQRGLAPIADAVTNIAEPDILAVQEVGDHWLMGPDGDTTRRLSEQFELPHTRFVPALAESRSDGPPARYGHALLSKWPIARSQVIDLPRREDEPRRLLNATVDHPSSPIDVLSTHLSHLDDERTPQGRFLGQWLNDHCWESDTRFVLGDLNATDSEPWLNELLGDWIDADTPRRRPTFPAHDPSRRIDYVLAQGATPVTTIVPVTPDASDHRPVITGWTPNSP